VPAGVPLRARLRQHGKPRSREDIMSAKMFAITTIALLGWAAVSPAAQPTVSDIATCNQEADLQAATPSASPPIPGSRPAPDATLATQAPGSSAERPDARAGGMTASEVRRGVGASESPTAQRTDPTGSVVTAPSDPFLEGMAADRANDPAYRMAYVDCMKRRMSGAR
jgi:hypothetical protein